MLQYNNTTISIYTSGALGYLDVCSLRLYELGDDLAQLLRVRQRPVRGQLLRGRGPVTLHRAAEYIHTVKIFEGG